MKNSEQGHITFEVSGNALSVRMQDGQWRRFAFPAFALSLEGKRIEAEKCQVPPRRIPGGFKAEYIGGPCRFIVTITEGGPGWLFKQVEVIADTDLPTPDYLEVDFQKTCAPGLRRCGYLCGKDRNIAPGSEEEGHGMVPGCGYPLMGDDFFTGLEHPAAFNTVISSVKKTFTWQLRHFPIWHDGRIKSVRAVLGFGDDPRRLFFDYLETVRLPRLPKPLMVFCTFWSDPYLGNMEYLVKRDSYERLWDAWVKLGLKPDLFLLDAGWQDRNSFFRAKRSYGGERALKALGRKVQADGARLGLWVSTNGPIGMDMDFLRSQGIAVGGGVSSHYSGDGYAVMMDEKLERTLCRRFCRLASPEYGVSHFKMDWDNECATAPGFDRTYPTRDHVREASIDMMARLARAEHRVNPETKLRNGHWPSPWYLMSSTHISLPDGGDCEYAAFPALNQRDAATNHRDFLYWCMYVRDGSVFPLDALDNHEFPHSLRNPFQETPGIWSNVCVWAVMRGTSYHQLTLMPEALEEWQVKILQRALEMARTHAKDILSVGSRMIGGNPAAGGIYGFIHGGNSLLALRNASPLPQEYRMPDLAPCYWQFYPDCRCLRASETTVFSPHEVKVFLCKNNLQEFMEGPCQLFPVQGGKYECYLPASRRASIHEIHQLPSLKLLHAKATKGDDGSLNLSFGLQVPWRVRDFKALFRIGGKNCGLVKVALFTSRYASCRVSAYAVPVAELPFGIRGSGEVKNMDAVREPDARYFAAELPQGGEVFCRLVLSGTALTAKDVELWVSGYEAPARVPERNLVELRRTCLPLPHPDGFPLNLRIW